MFKSLQYISVTIPRQTYLPHHRRKIKHQVGNISSNFGLVKFWHVYMCVLYKFDIIERRRLDFLNQVVVTENPEGCMAGMFMLQL